VIDLARQELEASMAYGLEPEPTSWPLPYPQEGGWIDLPTASRGERTELAEITEEEVTERMPAAMRPAGTERARLSVDDCWFFGAYRRFHAGVERAGDGPADWRPERVPVARRAPPSASQERDRRIRAAVQRALRSDPRFSANFVQVRCRDGGVTLSGTVADRAAKRRGEEIVEAIDGVRDVHNRLRIEAAPVKPARGA
jgi:hypothetical protein